MKPDRFAAALRGFGPAGIAAILVILAGNGLFVPLSAILVLAWAWRSGTPWHEIGYARPARWVRRLVAGILFGEETVFRGYLFERLGKLFGCSLTARVSIVLLTSVWFGAAHYPLGRTQHST